VAASNQQERIDEDKDDAMTALENRTRDTQKMVDTLDALDELKAMSQRNERIGAGALLSAIDEKRKVEASKLDDDDEAVLKGIKFGGGASDRRLGDSDEDDGFVLDQLEAVPEKRKKQKKMKQDAGEKDDAAAQSPAALAPPKAAAASEVGVAVLPASFGAAAGGAAGVDLLQLVAQRAAAERLQAQSKVPVLKRKLKAPAPDKAKKSEVAPLPEPTPAGGMLGLGAYGSSDSD
jgi:hypothetical protein